MTEEIIKEINSYSYPLSTPITTSYSEVSKWDTCHRQFYYNFGLGLQPSTPSEAVNLGIKGHKLLQQFYIALGTGMTKQKALDTVSKAAAETIKNEHFTDISILSAWILVEKFIRETEFPYETAFVEKRFMIPASKLTDATDLRDVMIGFTPDVVFKRAGNFYEIEDAKFTGRAWSQKKTNRTIQLKLYQIFLKKMGYKVSNTRIRFFNTESSKHSYQNSVLDPHEEFTILREFIQTVREVAKFKQQPLELQSLVRRTQNTGVCQYCPFEEPCTLELKGKDASNTLKYLYVKKEYDYNA